MRKFLSLILVLAMLAVLLACGGGGGGDTSSNGQSNSSSDVYKALNPKLQQAPIPQVILKRAINGQVPIVNAIVSYFVTKSNVPGFGSARIRAAWPMTDINGLAAAAVPADTYDQQLTIPAGLSVSPNYLARGANYNVSVSSSMTPMTYIADQYVFNVSANQAIADMRLTVYSTDSNGKIDWGTFAIVVNPMGNPQFGADVRDPVVFDEILPAINDTVASINVELFKGTYRVVVSSSAVDPQQQFATFISDVFTVAGGGNNEAIPVNIVQTGNPIQVVVNNALGLPLDNYTIRIKDSINFLTLANTLTDINGVASAVVPSSVTSVVIEVRDMGSQLRAVRQMTSLNPTPNTVTFQEYNVSGQLTKSAGDFPATPGRVFAKLNTGIGVRYDNTEVAEVQTTGTLQTFSGLTLFGTASTPLNYTLSASDIENYPDVTDTAVSVQNNDVTNVSIPVAAGGVIYGKVTTEANVNLNSVPVYVIKKKTDGTIIVVNAQATNATGDYSLQVPYGTYFLLANGGITEGVTVSAGSPLFQKNLTQYSLVGLISKDTGYASGASVFVGFQNAIANSIGSYSIDVMEGKNWFCVVPGSSDLGYGYVCNLNVLVDDSTVAAARAVAKIKLQKGN